MQKIFIPLIFGLVIFSSCRSAKEKTENPSTITDDSIEAFFPVTDYLKGQLNELDSIPVTPLKTITINGKTDSVWVKRENIRFFAEPFLTPTIDSISMSPYFSGKSFLDQTINAITFSYDAKTAIPDSIKLRHWDLYIDLQKSTVARVYMVKENTGDSANITTQLTWTVNKWCSIRTITQKQGKDPEIIEEKMTWGFDN